MEKDDRVWLIRKLNRYKHNLEKKRVELLEELFRYYYPDDDENENRTKRIDVKYINYTNPYEAYLTAQIKIGENLPELLEEHVHLLQKGEDLDQVLESLEFKFYRLKKDVYADIPDWNELLEFIHPDLLDKILNTPKGPGDFLLKELLWIRSFEERWKNKTEK